MVPEVEQIIIHNSNYFAVNFLIGSNSPANSLICYVAGNFEAVNSLNLAAMVVVSQHWQVTVHCYPLTL